MHEWKIRLTGETREAEGYKLFKPGTIITRYCRVSALTQQEAYDKAYDIMSDPCIAWHAMTVVEWRI